MTIEGFDDAVDGYRDVADLLRQSLLVHASEACGRERAVIRDLDSVAASSTSTSRTFATRSSTPASASASVRGESRPGASASRSGTPVS